MNRIRDLAQRFASNWAVGPVPEREPPAADCIVHGMAFTLQGDGV
jgi:hypothetical protein